MFCRSDDNHLRLAAYATGTQLKEDGLLRPRKTNLTVQRSVRGSVIQLWRLKSEILGCEDCETCEHKNIDTYYVPHNTSN